MVKVDYREIPASERQRMIREMSRLLLSVKTERDMIQLLYRLLTPSEIVMVGRRMQIGELMINGWSHDSIKEKLHVGSDTIRSVERWLEHVIRDYDQVRVNEKKRERARKSRRRQVVRNEPAQLGSFTHLRRRYKLDFLLVNLLLDSIDKQTRD